MDDSLLGAREKLLVAKADRVGGHWLPLYLHLTDTAGVMERLLSEYVSPSFSEMCELKWNEIERVAIFFSYLHDVGKATAIFQRKILYAVPFCEGRLEKHGIRIPSFSDRHEMGNTPHNLTGENILLSYGCPREIAVVVGAHHGIPTTNKELNDQSFSLEDYPAYWDHYFVSRKDELVWRKIWEHYIEYGLLQSGIECMENLPKLNRQAQMLLTGLLIMADWVASNTEWFPLLSLEDWEDERGTVSRIQEGWEAFHLTDAWSPVNEIFSETLFRQTFHFPPRQLQKEVLNRISQTEQPGIYIVEAPMGCGKTEIALAAAEMLAAKFGKSGIFMGLPTQATANGVFPRVLQWAEKQSDHTFQSIQLAHGSSMMNQAFMEVERGIPDVYDGDLDGGIVVHSWFCGKKQSCLADFVVGTVDQFLMAALKRKHVMLLHLGLSQKVVIIDEVHAYDAYMNCYLERALSWMGMYHTPVILLSATLPAGRRTELISAYLNQKNTDRKEEVSNAYPLLTWTDGEAIFQETMPFDGDRHEISIELCAEDRMISEVQKAADAGGCVGVIVNTVKRAQKYAELFGNYGSASVFLYHAQYIAPDRMSKENTLLQIAGKESGKQERSGRIVIGSQVLEQSLDLDFDLLVTDLCPIDLLLQRMGRLHRHKGHDAMRSDCARKERCLILEADDLELEPGAKRIYGEWLLTQTRTVIPDKITIPDDIPALIQSVYRDRETDSEKNEIYENFRKEKRQKENKAKGFLLEKAKKKQDIHGLLKAGISDAGAEASVRDGLSSIEVLVMVKDDCDQLFFLPWQNEGKKITDEDIDDSVVCREIAGQRLRLPSVLCQVYNVDQTIAELERQCGKWISAWQRSHWLKGELVLFLNQNLECVLNGYRLRYSQEMGLSYDKNITEDSTFDGEEEGDEGERV